MLDCGFDCAEVPAENHRARHWKLKPLENHFPLYHPCPVQFHSHNVPAFECVAIYARLSTSHRHAFPKD